MRYEMLSLYLDVRGEIFMQNPSFHIIPTWPEKWSGMEKSSDL